MRSRADNFSKDIHDAIRTMKGGIVPDTVQKSFFYLIAKVQQAVETATWLGAWRKGWTSSRAMRRRPCSSPVEL